MKRYELTNETKIIKAANGNHIVLYRIRATQTFAIQNVTGGVDTHGNPANAIVITAGTLGGYVQDESNLEQNSLAWVMDNAIACGSSYITDSAVVSGGAVVVNTAVKDSARIFDSARVSGSIISGHSKVYGYTKISGNTSIGGHAEVKGFSCIDGFTVYGHAIINIPAVKYAVSGDPKPRYKFPQTIVEPHACIAGNIQVTSHDDFLVIGPFAYNDDGHYVTFAVEDDGKLHLYDGSISVVASITDTMNFRQQLRNTGRYPEGIIPDIIVACEYAKLYFNRRQNKA